MILLHTGLLPVQCTTAIQSMQVSYARQDGIFHPMMNGIHWKHLLAEKGGGNKLKETGKIHWTDETEGTNEYGFTAIPSGWRSNLGYFSKIGNSVDWWTTTEYDANDLWDIGISPE